MHEQLHPGASAVTGSVGQLPVRHRVMVCVLSGVLLGCSFPPFPLGFLACFGLVPLLVVLSDVDQYWPALRLTYIAMVVFHVITLNWTGGYVHGHDMYMMIAGAVTMLVHPLFYWIPVAAYIAVKRHLGNRAALTALPFLWVAYEYTHSLSQWSFPWLTIGNSQTYNLAGIQMVSTTGVYGLSFWIIVLNVLVFLLTTSIGRQGGPLLQKRTMLLAVGTLVLYLLPIAYGTVVLRRHPAEDLLPRPGSPSVTVGMVQPNLDPWDKWTLSGVQTIELYERETRRLMDSVGSARPDIVLWPETAIPIYLLVPRYAGLLGRFKQDVTGLGVSVLSGLPQAVFYPDSSRAPRTAKRIPGTGERFDAFNAAAFFQPGSDSIPWYGKMKMVPLAERVPYAEMFAFLDFLRWDVGIGGWQVGPDSTIFRDRRTGTRFCTMICYESVYPSFVASFVRKGAEFIAIITIDSWWGKMSGAYQHAQFAILRAVENHRWVARCALGGISCYIDPYGRIYDRTDLLTPALLSMNIGRTTELTTYTQAGDWLSEICLIVSGLFLMASLGQRFRRQQKNT